MALSSSEVGPSCWSRLSGWSRRRKRRDTRIVFSPSITGKKNHDRLLLMSVSSKELVSNYRQLYQALLRAVRYSKPARYLCRDRLRNAFRNSPPEAFDPQRIANTLHFLDCASKTAGLEHKIVKNLAFVWWEKSKMEQRHA